MTQIDGILLSVLLPVVLVVWLDLSDYLRVQPLTGRDFHRLVL